MNDLSLPRETGSQKAGVACPNCGVLLPAVTSAYGSVAVGACPTCWPSTAPSQLVAQTAAAEVNETVPLGHDLGDD